MMTLAKKVALFALLSVASVQGQRVCAFRALNITSDPSFGYGTARLTQSNKKGLDFNITILNPVSAIEGYVKASVLMKYSTSSAYHAFVGGKSYNLCDFLSSTHMDPIIRKYIKMFNKYTPLLRKCPFQAGNYTLNNFQVDVNLVPSFVPVGSYAFKMGFTRFANQKHSPLMNLDFYGEILPK